MLILDKSKFIKNNDLDLSEFIQPGDNVICGQASGEPVSLTEKLVEQRERIGAVNLFLGLSLSESFQPEHADYISFDSFGPMGNTRRLFDAGVLNITPVNYAQINQYINEGTLACDVALVLLSPPGPDGKHGFGLVNDYIRAAINKARVVIGEVNDQVPWVYSEGSPEISKFSAIIETSRPLLTVDSSKVSSVDNKIAKIVGRYIEDGSVLQIGMGSIPEAIATSIGDRRDLGFHSGMAGDYLVDLMEKGVVTNELKPIDRGVSTTAVLVGSKRLYDFVRCNKAVKLRPSWHTHSGDLHRFDRLISVNSALEVDLTGQVGAEEINGIAKSAIGGQPDLVRAAHRSAGGHAIIALPSSAVGGKISRIVKSLSGPVTTPRSDVDVVVTENGFADLRGKNLVERKRLLIKLAAPQFKAALMDDKHIECP